MKVMEVILKLDLNGKHYLKGIGCAFGIAAIPSYATTFMGRFVEKHIYPFIVNDCIFYARHIDDTFFIYTGKEEKAY